MHFMNPLPIMKLVEIIRGIQTKDEVYQVIHELSEKMGKIPVEVIILMDLFLTVY